MSKATAVRTEPSPSYDRPTLRVLADPRPQDEARMRMLTPMAIGLSLALWAAIVALGWLVLG